MKSKEWQDSSQLFYDSLYSESVIAFWLADTVSFEPCGNWYHSGLLPVDAPVKKKKQKTKYDHDWGTPVGSGDVIGYNYDGTIDTVNNYMMPMPTYPYPDSLFMNNSHIPQLNSAFSIAGYNAKKAVRCLNKHCADTTYLCGCESRLYRDSVLKINKNIKHGN
jgi:hypothetical protein